ncbi:MAG: chemotaxis protein CheW, partial [Gammaproteobacteria bacterium]|nr:chemotaxis protein CheW [Gammaproteobacteria bacterium]
MKAIELDEQLLIFRVGPVACCVAARDIDSIVNAQALHKLPRQADFIAGVLQYRETAVSIVNLFHKFALSTPETPLHGRFVMAYTRHGVTGFWVDEIIEITNDFEQNWSSAPSFLEEKVFDRTLLWHDKLILQTDFDRLFAMKASGALSEWANKNDTNWDIRKADSVKVKAVDNEEASYKANAESELIISDLVTRGTVFSQPVVSLVSTFDEDNPDLIPPQFTMQNTTSDLAMEEHSIGLEEVFNGNNEIISEVERDQVLDVDSKTALTNENTNKITDEVLNEITINNEGRSEASSIDVTTSLISTSTNNDTVFELVIQEKDSVLVEDMSNVNSDSTDALLSEVSLNVESDVVDENQLDLDLTLSGVDEEKSKDIEVLNLDTQLESFSEPDYHIDSSLVIDLSSIEEDVEQGFKQSDVNDTLLDRSVLSNSTFDNHSNSSNLVMKDISDPETEIEIDFDLVSDIASDTVPESTPNTTSSKSDFDSIGPVPFSDETVTLDFISEENDHFLVDDSEVFIDKADSTKTIIIDSLAANFEEDVEGYFAKNLDEQISIYQKSVESQLLALAGKTEKEKEREEKKQEAKEQEEKEQEKENKVPQKELLNESKRSFVDEDISKSGIDVESKNATLIDSFSTFEKTNVNKFDLEAESELSDLEIRTNQSTFTALVDEYNNKSEITSLEEFSENPETSGFGGNESVDWHGSDSK